jgi:hypothetical protein
MDRADLVPRLVRRVDRVEVEDVLVGDGARQQVVGRVLGQAEPDRVADAAVALDLGDEGVGTHADIGIRPDPAAADADAVPEHDRPLIEQVRR